MSTLARLAASRTKRGARAEGPPGPWTILAAWGPCGFAPVAPGTFGTLGAIPLWWAMTWLDPRVYLAVTVLFVAVSVVAAHLAARHWGVADASPIVIDEVAGYLVTMALVPASWPAAVLGFFLFRLYDILKPWPASAFDRVKNGFGVVMDDVAAGVFAWATLQFVAVALQLVLGCGAEYHWWCAALGS